MWRMFLDNKNQLFVLVSIFKASRNPIASQREREQAYYKWRVVHFDDVDWDLTAREPQGYMSMPDIMSEMNKSWNSLFVANLSRDPPKGLRKPLEDLKLTRRLINKDPKWKGPVQAQKFKLGQVSTGQHVLASTQVTVQPKLVGGGALRDDESKSEEGDMGESNTGRRGKSVQKKNTNEEERAEQRRLKDRERKRLAREKAKLNLDEQSSNNEFKIRKVSKLLNMPNDTITLEHEDFQPYSPKNTLKRTSPACPTCPTCPTSPRLQPTLASFRAPLQET